jgi:hypothetical protein
VAGVYTERALLAQVTTFRKQDLVRILTTDVAGGVELPKRSGSFRSPYILCAAKRRRALRIYSSPNRGHRAFRESCSEILPSKNDLFR